MESLGTKIRKAREEKGFSQADLARLMNMKHPSVITHWEQDTNKPDVDKLAQLCQILDADPAFMLGLKDSQKELSTDDITLIKKMHYIDDSGRRLITNVIQHEYSRCQAIPNIDAFPPQCVELLPLFLYDTDQDYDEMKKKSKKLNALKNNVGASVEGITRFLWMSGYNELISFRDVLGILSRKKVPSPRLYDHIYSYLTKSYHVFINKGESQYD